MDTFRSLLASYGLAAFAADVGVRENTAKQMRKRDSVAPEYWEAWVAGARARGRADITYERLARIAAARRAQSPPPSHPRPPEMTRPRPIPARSPAPPGAGSEHGPHRGCAKTTGTTVP